ncbi:MAG: 1-acyl-sn-glycerol-3-phosphate acyltransferase [Mogibacterium sp.]|nr:1-acyl-sn-glycerol-3-phosphate acyltransferase [Mogibacterium sp.]
MINVFKTGPRLIKGYIETKRYNSLKNDLEQLRAAGDIEGEKEMIRKGQKRWVETMAPVLGLTFDVRGEENIPAPSDGPFMIYCNHQSFADIPATLWLMKDHGQMGYVSKEEWRKYGVLRDVIEYTRSIFLVRDNPKEAVRALSEAKKLLGMGFNLLIFPEGTRSKGPEMGDFKTGAFKFAEKAKVPILPVTVDGSYKFFEEKGTWQPAHIKVTAHPLVHIEQMDKEGQKEAAKQIEATVRSAIGK